MSSSFIPASQAVAILPVTASFLTATSLSAVSTWQVLISVLRVYPSAGTYSSFTTSCSLFSSGSPWRHTVLVHSVASKQQAGFGSSDSYSGYSFSTEIVKWIFSSVVFSLFWIV